MATSYVQTDTSATFNVGCSGATAATTTVARTATVGGTAGSTAMSGSWSYGQTVAAYAFELPAPGSSITSWAGSWTIPINITTCDAGDQMSAVYLCDWLPGTGYVTKGSATPGSGYTHTRGNTGVVSVSITASSGLQSASLSQPFIVVVFNNNDAHGGAGADITPSETITAPYTLSSTQTATPDPGPLVAAAPVASRSPGVVARAASVGALIAVATAATATIVQTATVDPGPTIAHAPAVTTALSTTISVGSGPAVAYAPTVTIPQTVAATSGQLVATATPAQGTVWLNGWAHRFKITSDSTLVDEAVTNLVFDLADAPTAFWDNVRSDGGDIRVTRADGGTYVAREISQFDTGTSRGLLFLNTPDLSTTEDVSYYVYSGAPAQTEPGAATTYGRESVWDSDYLLVSHQESASSPINSCGSGITGSVSGTPTLIDFGLNKGLRFTGSTTIDWSTFSAVQRPICVETIFRCSVAPDNARGTDVHGKGDDFGDLWCHTTAGRENRVIQDSTVLTQYPSASANTVYWRAFRSTTSITRTFHNGTFNAETSAANDGGTGQTYIRQAEQWSGTAPTRDFGEVRVSQSARSDNFISTHYNNQSDPTTFWTTGASETQPLKTGALVIYAPDVTVFYDQSAAASAGSAVAYAPDVAFSATASLAATSSPLVAYAPDVAVVVGGTSRAVDAPQLVATATPAQATLWLAGWATRFKITSDPALVDEAVTNLVYDLADAPGAFWDAVKSDGGDIRVTLADGITEVAREVVGIDTGSSKGILFIETPDLSTSVGTSYWIYSGNASASEPAVDASNGRESVWDANYLYVLHGETFTTYNSCGSGKAITYYDLSTDDPESVVDFGIYKGLQVTHNSQYIELGGWGTTPIEPITVEEIIRGASAPNTTDYFAFEHYDALRLNWGAATTAAQNHAATKDGASAVNVTFGTLSANTTYWRAATIDGTYLNTYLDGSFVAQAAKGSTPTGSHNDYAVALGWTAGTTFNRTTAEIRVSDIARSANYLSTQYNVQSDPTTFWDTSTAQTRPVVTPAPAVAHAPTVTYKTHASPQVGAFVAHAPDVTYAVSVAIRTVDTATLVSVPPAAVAIPTAGAGATTLIAHAPAAIGIGEIYNVASQLVAYAPEVTTPSAHIVAPVDAAAAVSVSPSATAIYRERVDAPSTVAHAPDVTVAQSRTVSVEPGPKIARANPVTTPNAAIFVSVAGGPQVGYAPDVLAGTYTKFPDVGPVVLHAPRALATLSGSNEFDVPTEHLDSVYRAVSTGATIAYAPAVTITFGATSESAGSAVTVAHAPVPTVALTATLSANSAPAVAYAPAVTTTTGAVTRAVSTAQAVTAAPAVTASTGGTFESTGSAVAVAYAPATTVVAGAVTKAASGGSLVAYAPSVTVSFDQTATVDVGPAVTYAPAAIAAAGATPAGAGSAPMIAHAPDAVGSVAVVQVSADVAPAVLSAPDAVGVAGTRTVSTGSAPAIAYAPAVTATTAGSVLADSGPLVAHAPDVAVAYDQATSVETAVCAAWAPDATATPGAVSVSVEAATSALYAPVPTITTGATTRAAGSAPTVAYAPTVSALLVGQVVGRAAPTVLHAPEVDVAFDQFAAVDTGASVAAAPTVKAFVDQIAAVDTAVTPLAAPAVQVFVGAHLTTAPTLVVSAPTVAVYRFVPVVYPTTVEIDATWTTVEVDATWTTAAIDGTTTYVEID